ncbi:LppP/LprE family lipoprotein [Parafrankia sp. FMc6]|uniref:LppP/LprE family lipoprotein n=1 Tax=Parafrankia soli TaxID=2599596 RepID=UPI0034D3AC06
MRRVVFISVLAAAVILSGAASAVSAAPTAVQSPPAATPGAARSPGAVASSGAVASPSGPGSSAVVAGSLSLAEASGLVRGRGYTPITTDGYEPTHDLSVIVGRLSTSVDGHPQQAFFFHRGRFVGTDAAASAGVRWVWSTSEVVALQYDLYRPADPMCCPSAGAASVRFRWDGTSVVPLDPIPTSKWTAAESRR